MYEIRGRINSYESMQHRVTLFDLSTNDAERGYKIGTMEAFFNFG